MAEKYFFEEKNAKKAASKARTTARQAAENRKPGAFTAAVRANLKKELSKGGKLDKAPARSKAGASTAAAVGKRFGITAREARDIATALGTLSQTRKTSAGGTKEEARKNLKQQIKEVGAAAAKGKKGTTSKEYNPTFSIMTVGKKRK